MTYLPRRCISDSMISIARPTVVGIAALLTFAGLPGPANASANEPHYTVTIRHLDRSGTATVDFLDTVVNRRTAEALESSQDGDTTTLQVPAGQYLVDSLIGIGKGSIETSQLIQPRLDVDSDLTLTIDARQARQVRIDPPSSAVHEVRTVVDSNYTVNNRGYSTSVSTRLGGPERIYTAQLGPSVPGLTSAVRSIWAQPTAKGFDDTPVSYSLAWPAIDGYPTGYTKAVNQRDLATLRPTLVAQAPGTIASLGYDGFGADEIMGGGYTFTYRTLPATPTVYVNTNGLSWQTSAYYFTDDGGFGLSGDPATYQPSGTYTDVIGSAVFGQAQGRPQFNSRTGDTLRIAPLQADARSHTSWAATGHGSLVLRRNGTQLANLPYPFTTTPGEVDVPPGPADYRVEASTVSTGILDVSTAVRASWGFRSDTTKTQTPLPLWTVTARPAVDAKNVVRTRRTHRLPITATAPDGSTAGKVTTLTVQISTDDGATWRSAPVHETYATVTVPAGAQYVSLRTHLVDSMGNTADQEIKRAYKVSPLT
ncbi:hypothetical protein AB0E69_34910 [Kribbella sp. NPDC026611]|uniref:hypothetical protein n=1 Tax=Kribbella sp. NPDC026611 TaxID=3154911 RepID=UPI0033DF3501